MWPNQSDILRFILLLILLILTGCLRFYFLQYNVILIKSTFYPGCGNCTWHPPDFDIFSYCQSPFLPCRSWTVWLSCESLIATSWLSRLCRGHSVEMKYYPPPQPNHRFISCNSSFLLWLCVAREILCSMQKTIIKTFLPWRLVDISLILEKDFFLPFNL